MTVRPFLPKDDQELPDSYTITIHYLDGRKPDEIEVASHRTIDTVVVALRAEQLPDGTIREIPVLAPAPAPFIELCLVGDLWSWVPMSSVKRIEFDKNFSKLVALKEKRAQERREATLAPKPKAPDTITDMPVAKRKGK